jgi:hypothetical protein
VMRVVPWESPPLIETLAVASDTSIHYIA